MRVHPFRIAGSAVEKPGTVNAESLEGGTGALTPKKFLAFSRPSRVYFVV
jgi:hypothetical protein